MERIPPSPPQASGKTRHPTGSGPTLAAARPLLIAAAVFTLAVGVGAVLIRQAEELDLAAQRAAALNVASDAGYALEQQLSRSLSAAYALAAMIRREGDIAGFNELAAELLPLHAGASSLVLAPDGIIRDIWPPAKGVIGFNLLKEASRSAEARAAIESRQLSLGGPSELKQGGLGLVGRLPVFVPRPGGGNRFWGFANVVVKLPDLLAASGTPRLGEAGYDWALSRAGEGGASTTFSSSQAGPLPLPVTMDVTVPSGKWTLAVARRGGWRPSPIRKMGYPVTLVVAAVLALLAFRVSRAPELLLREVAARTADLARANEALAADIAERQRTEEQLRQSQKMDAIGQLAGGVAHDFNNLLTGILGYASLLVETGAPNSPEAEAGQAILEAGKRAAALTRQLLGLARRGKLLNAPVDVHAVVGEVVRFLARTLDRSIALRQDLRAPRAVVIGDAGQIHQILLNLAVNARDAMKGGGLMTFATEEVSVAAGGTLAPGRTLAISVRDTGIGIPPENRERIFEPFFTTKPKGEGTGLGLATVYGITRNHGGTVSVESEPGKGSSFTVRLPLAGDARLAPLAREREAVPRGDARILVVDDEPDVLAVTSRMLQELGYRPLLAAGGKEALEEFRAAEGRVDLVLLDMSMPAMDGLACLQALREMDPGVRVVVMSGYALDGRAQQMIDGGAAAFVQKPYQVGDLAKALDFALRQPGSAAEPLRASPT